MNYKMPEQAENDCDDKSNGDYFCNVIIIDPIWPRRRSLTSLFNGKGENWAKANK